MRCETEATSVRRWLPGARHRPSTVRARRRGSAAARRSIGAISQVNCTICLSRQRDPAPVIGRRFNSSAGRVCQLLRGTSAQRYYVGNDRNRREFLSITTEQLSQLTYLTQFMPFTQLAVSTRRAGVCARIDIRPMWSTWPPHTQMEGTQCQSNSQVFPQCSCGLSPRRSLGSNTRQRSYFRFFQIGRVIERSDFLRLKLSDASALLPPRRVTRRLPHPRS